VAAVRTNIEIDDQLVSEAMRSSGAPTKKAAVEAGLRLLVKTHSQTAIRQLRGKVQWDGDLNESRLGRIRD
jgi:Arc/MetJ family transcription regulator